MEEFRGPVEPSVSSTVKHLVHRLREHADRSVHNGILFAAWYQLWTVLIAKQHPKNGASCWQLSRLQCDHSLAAALEYNLAHSELAAWKQQWSIPPSDSALAHF